MEFALLRCCVTPVFLKQYESSTDSVLKALGVEFRDIKEFNCCGYPLKNIDFMAHVLLSASNLSLAEAQKLNILTFCNCCYGTLKHVNHLLQEDPGLLKEVNETLKKEGLKYEGTTEVKHLLEVFYRDIGIEQIRKKIVKPFEGLKLATHYGCHLLRPRQIVQFDNPISPTLFDKLVEVTGAESIPWPNKMECCGSPILGINDDLSKDLTAKKISGALLSGADFLSVACPFCQLQFDRVQRMHLSNQSTNDSIPSLIYTQIIGLSLGIDPEILGIHQNEIDGNGIHQFMK